MDSFWKASLAVGGLAAIGAFVFWSLYKDWLALPIFSKMTPDQTFEIMKMFLCFTFSCFVLSAIIYATKRDNRFEKIEKIKDEAPITENSNAIEEQSSDFILLAAPLIFDVIIFGEQQEYRNIKPWTDQLRSIYKNIARKLRELSIQDVSIQEEWEDSLNELADSIDRVTNMKFGIFCSWTKEIEDIVAKAMLLKEIKIDPFFVKQESLLKLKDDFLLNVRMLKNFNGRSGKMLEQNKTKELQNNVSRIGHALLRLSMYNTESFPRKVKEKLHDISKKMHLMETEKNYSSIAQESFRERLGAFSRQLNELAIEIR